jgi:DNA modification methylase
MIDLRNGDCIEQMRQLPANSVDSIVTDPPYELGFMGKSWDSTGIAYSVKMWDEALRVLKPGGHLLAFSGSRTYHRMAVAIEDAGFEIRDQIMWVYGSGFPKSMDVSKAIDKQAGIEREVLGSYSAAKQKGSVAWNGHNRKGGAGSGFGETANITTPTTDKAKQWAGWGTALKPAHEPIVLARKPLIGTVATNVIIHGTGALNIDGSRVGTDGGTAGATFGDGQEVYGNGLNGERGIPVDGLGRWPANFIHDGSDEVVELLEDAARFFYCAKASKKDRNEGLDNFAGKEVGTKGNGLARTCASCGASTLQGCECPDRTYVNPTRANHHPTVKPTELMRYLVRLVTPPEGTVLDPFMGSGSTGKAAVLEGFNFIGIDQSADYLEIATARIKHAQDQVEGMLL